ncbi:hypothetical protein AB0I21_42560, partial [Dactylosporangium sp. NPDC050588]
MAESPLTAPGAAMTDDPAVETGAHSGHATTAGPARGVLPAAPASTLPLSSRAAAAVPGRRRWPLLGGAAAVSRVGTASWPRRWLLLGGGAGAVFRAGTASWPRRWLLLGGGAGAVFRAGTASWPRRWLLLG